MKEQFQYKEGRGTLLCGLLLGRGGSAGLGWARLTGRMGDTGDISRSLRRMVSMILSDQPATDVQNIPKFILLAEALLSP